MKRFLARNIIIALALFIAFSSAVHAQKATKGKVVVKTSKVGLLVKNSGYESLELDKSAWELTSDDKKVLVGTDPDNTIVVIFMTIAPKNGYKITAESMTEMLKLANDLDHVKFIIDENGSLMVRSDARFKLIDQAAFNDTVNRVLNGYNLASEKLAPFLIK